MSIFICSFCKCNIGPNKNIYYAYDYNYCSADCRLKSIKHQNKKPSLQTLQSLVDTSKNYTDNTYSSTEDKLSISETHREISNDSSYKTDISNITDISNNKLENITQEFTTCTKIRSHKSVKNLNLIDSIPERTTYKNFRDCNRYFDYSLSLVVFVVNTIYNIE